MRDLKNKLTSGKNTKNIKSRKGKSFGYQVLGFGSGGGPSPYLANFLVIAGGGGGGAHDSSGGGGAGGYRTSFPSGTTIDVAPGDISITIGAGGAGHVGDPENSAAGVSGSNSVFSSITSAGGGGGGGCRWVLVVLEVVQDKVMQLLE